MKAKTASPETAVLTAERKLAQIDYKYDETVNQFK